MSPTQRSHLSTSTQRREERDATSKKMREQKKSLATSENTARTGKEIPFFRVA